MLSPIRMLPELSRAALWGTTMLRTNLSVCVVCVVVSSRTVGLGHCWTTGRGDLGWGCVALGLETGSLCEYVYGKQDIVVGEYAIIG